MLGQGEGDGVGIHPVGLSVAIEAQGRNDGHNALGQKALEHFDIDPFHLAGELVVYATDNAERMGDNGIGGHRAEIVGRQPFKDLMGEPVGGIERELQGLRIGDAGAIEIGGLDPALHGQRRDLLGSTVHKQDSDVQRAEDRDVEQEVREVVVGDDGSIDGQDEDLFPEAWNVAENSPQVGGFHVVLSNRPVGRYPKNNQEHRRCNEEIKEPWLSVLRVGLLLKERCRL